MKLKNKVLFSVLLIITSISLCSCIFLGPGTYGEGEFYFATTTEQKFNQNISTSKTGTITHSGFKSFFKQTQDKFTNRSIYSRASVKSRDMTYAQLVNYIHTYKLDIEVCEEAVNRLLEQDHVTIYFMDDSAQLTTVYCISR